MLQKEQNLEKEILELELTSPCFRQTIAALLI